MDSAQLGRVCQRVVVREQATSACAAVLPRLQCCGKLIMGAEQIAAHLRSVRHKRSVRNATAAAPHVDDGEAAAPPHVGDGEAAAALHVDDGEAAAALHVDDGEAAGGEDTP
jgi:hypothetical protein